MTNDYLRSANYLFEIGIHAKTPRSGFWNLGSGHQSLAEHTHRAVHAGLVLAALAGDVDTNKILQMCLFHDLAEGRTSDLNYVHQQYAQADESLALKHIQESVPFGDRIEALHKEYKERTTREAILAKEADHIELLLTLKEQKDLGNPQVERWLEGYLERFKTTEGRALAEAILETNMSDWWFKGKDAKEYWVDRKHHKGQAASL
jgi:putative hydrolase of HD superfamily